MILEILKDSLTYSLKDFNIIARLGILNLLSFLIVPFFLVQGYSYNITTIGVNSIIHGKYEIPPFENWKNMFVNGIKRTLVMLIYSIPALIISIWALLNPETIQLIIPSNLLYLDIGIEITAMIFLWIFTFILIMVAIPHMIHRKSLKAAFNIKELITIIKSVGFLEYIYFVAWWIIIASGVIFLSFVAVEIFVSILNFIYLIIFSQIISLSFMNISFDMYLFGLVLILLVYPFLLIVESRATASMYNLN
ncbi:DUF4013 domain-containing protein [Methanobrevibacter sp. TMH8]|uniref:DUF4013 domain-containing protein n=1 Tax=Methanobrevibacter sp. TMH8 TaxID=2848611 RepID=UPI001CCD80C7|nr:DUF4013 domain-containing protein [Methanobrevibacter sp. TMH8]MBZ9571145.1 DUF4013 domain-containing protein [Methanobrevibacter sp. TMH8]